MATDYNVWAWSTTPADNATADGSINWAEGQDPATVNNSARAMMTAIAKMSNVQGGDVGVALSGGDPNAIQITTNQTISAGHQALGFRICFRATATNTGATTVAVDALSAVAIKRPNGDALSAGDIVSGAFHDIAFDGTNYRLMVPGAGGNYGSLSGGNTWTGINYFTGNVAVGDTAADAVSIQGTTVNPAMSALMSNSSVAALRTAIGLGDAATQSITNSGGFVPTVNYTNSWTANQTISTPAGSISLSLVHPNSTTLPNLYSNLTGGTSGAGFYQAWFLANGVLVGSISQTQDAGFGSVQYNTTSDDRLKSGQRPLDDSGAVIDQLQPIRFTWKGGSAEDFGFSAQALHAVVPQAVTPGKGKPGDKDFIPWMREHGRLEAILVAEIQALRARVAALEAAA